MTWQESINKAANIGNLPGNMTTYETSMYKRYQAEIWFNEYHHINSGATECLKNHKHAIIADCLYRR